jgi:hypothetical protein
MEVIVQFPDAPEGETLEESRSRVFSKWQEGIHCPCCTQYVKLDDRKFASDMAYFLCRLVAAYENDPRWYHFSELTEQAGGDRGRLVFPWGFAVKPSDQDGMEIRGSRRSGCYKPTKEGIEAAHGRTRFPAKAWMFNWTLYGWDDEMINIQTALGRKWKWEEVIAWTPLPPKPVPPNRR